MDNNLIVLIWVSILAIAVVAVFLVKLLYDLSDLTRSMRKGSEMIQDELEPTLKELNEAATSLNKVTRIAKDHAEGIQKTIQSITNATSSIGSKIQGMFGGLISGLQAGLKLFKK